MAASLMVSLVRNIEGSEGKVKRKEKKEREARAEEKRIVEEREREEWMWGVQIPIYQACRLTSTSLREGLEPSPRTLQNPRNQFSSLDINSTRYTFWILKNREMASSKLKASDLRWPFSLSFNHFNSHRYPYKLQTWACELTMASDGVLSDESGALVIKPCTAREVAFYTSAAEHPRFQKCMPSFL